MVGCVVVLIFVKAALIGVCTVKLNGVAAFGSVVLTVMLNKSFGMIFASYNGRVSSKSFTASGFWRYGTFL